MVAIGRAGASPQAVSRAPARTAPNLDAQIRTCRAQLADWVTCPSAKTPEGKAKIEQISAKLESIKSEVKKSNPDDGSAVANAAQSSARADTPRAPAQAFDYTSAPNQAGNQIDTYA